MRERHAHHLVREPLLLRKGLELLLSRGCGTGLRVRRHADVACLCGSTRRTKDQRGQKKFHRDSISQDATLLPLRRGWITKRTRRCWWKLVKARTLTGCSSGVAPSSNACAR